MYSIYQVAMVPGHVHRLLVRWLRSARWLSGKGACHQVSGPIQFQALALEKGHTHEGRHMHTHKYM